ncbi:MAG: glycosyltransferase family 2 protein [Chromatiales bacterium]|nr:glycosyltransferase family 2 protein [Chromatiales bacterium]
MSLPVSAALITRDAADTLRSCLASLSALDEVIVYDNGSTDATCNIARSFANVSLHEGPFLGFGPTKNHAASLARHDWVLSVDADEAVSPELLASIQAADLLDPRVVYRVHRHNFLLGRRVRHSGWGRDWLPRLYHRAHARYSDVQVHERVVFGAGTVLRDLAGPLRHDAVRDLGSFLRKVDRYSELRRQDPPRAGGAFVISLRSAWAFLHTFLLRGGILDGWRGLVIAVSDANGVFFKHMKRHADRRVAAEQLQDKEGAP